MPHRFGPNGLSFFSYPHLLLSRSTIDYKKGKGSSSTSNSLSTASVNGKNWGADTGGWGQSDPSTSSNARAGFPSNPSPNATTSSNALAPAPRVVAPNIASTGDQQIDGLTNGLANMLDGGKDTWEISLEDSDYDDGWQPRKIDNRPKPIQKDEWYEGKLASSRICDNSIHS